MLSATITAISDARPRAAFERIRWSKPLNENAQSVSSLSLQCRPTKEGEVLVFPYSVSNAGPDDIYVSDAYPGVDRATRTPYADRNGATIMLQADGYALVLRGVPPAPPFAAMHPVDPLMHRLRAGEQVERQLSIPLPLAETSPYQPYGNIRDYVLKPISGVELAIDWITANVQGFVATPDVGSLDLFTVRATNYLHDMRRVSCRFPARGLSILQHALKG